MKKVVSNCHKCLHFEKLTDGGLCWWQAKKIHETLKLTRNNITMLYGLCKMFKESEEKK